MVRGTARPATTTPPRGPATRCAAKELARGPTGSARAGPYTRGATARVPAAARGAALRAAARLPPPEVRPPPRFPPPPCWANAGTVPERRTTAAVKAAVLVRCIRTPRVGPRHKNVYVPSRKGFASYYRRP